MCACIFLSVIGRPRVDVEIEDIEYLRQLRFSWTCIAKILNISRSTLYRRLDEEGLSRQLTFTNISDQELDMEMEDINPLLQRIFLLTIVVVVVFSATGCWCITNLK